MSDKKDKEKRSTERELRGQQKSKHGKQIENNTYLGFLTDLSKTKPETVFEPRIIPIFSN